MFPSFGQLYALFSSIDGVIHFAKPIDYDTNILWNAFWDLVGFFSPNLCRFSLMGYFPGKLISKVGVINSFFRWTVLTLIRNLAIFPSFLKLLEDSIKFLQGLLYLTSCWISCLPWSKMLAKCLFSKLLSKNHLY